jgi:hypothetical protein
VCGAQGGICRVNTFFQSRSLFSFIKPKTYQPPPLIYIYYELLTVLLCGVRTWESRTLVLLLILSCRFRVPELHQSHVINMFYYVSLAAVGNKGNNGSVMRTRYNKWAAVLCAARGTFVTLSLSVSGLLKNIFSSTAHNWCMDTTYFDEGIPQTLNLRTETRQFHRQF